MEPKIRRRLPTDIEPLCEVLCRVHNASGYPVEGVDDPVAWLSPKDYMEAFTAEVGGKVVGNVIITDSEHHLVLCRLFVSIQTRGRGIGEGLVKAAMELAHNQKKPLQLEVLAKDTKAISLYQKLGWTQVGQGTHTAQGKTYVRYTFRWNASTPQVV